MDNLSSTSIVGNIYALDRFTDEEIAALEARQLGGEYVRLGDSSLLSSEEEERRAIIQARAEAKLGSPQQRFWRKVRIPDDPDIGCWSWIGAKNQWGVGVMNVDGRPVSVHRFAWSLYFDDVAPAALSQSCGNRSCVRREHLLRDRGDKTVSE